MVPTTPFPTTIKTTKTTIITKTVRVERKPEIVYPPCETSDKTNPSTERCYVGTNAANNRPLAWKSKPEGQSGPQQEDAQNSMTGGVRAAAQHLN